MSRGGDSENVAGTSSADNGASEGANSGQTATEQGQTTQTGDDLQQGTEAPGTESQEPAAAEIAEVNGKSFTSLQAAIDAAREKATVKLLANTKENVTISTKNVTLDLNGYTLNGSTGERKPALTVTSRVYVKDSSQAQTGTIMREDTKENSGVSSHYVIDVQGGKSGWLFFQGGNVKNDSGAGGTNGASLVRVGDDKQPGLPHMIITGGTFTQNNFIVLKCDSGILSVAGGTINSANSYAIQNWKTTYIKVGDNGTSPVINGNVSTWTYKGSGSSLEISGGTVTGKVESVTYDGAAGKPAKVAITGGTVKGQLYTLGYNSSTGTSTEIKDPAKATIEVKGGTFSADPLQYVAGNFETTKNADGTYGVAKAQAQPIAQVGETKYNTMDEARDAQAKTGKAITLLRDYTTGSKFNSGTGDCVVDLSGHTWTYTGTDANSAAFEINYSNASLTVKNGNVVSSQLIGLISFVPGVSSDITYDNSKLTFEGVDASTSATSGIETNGNNTNDTVVLKNSTLNVPNGFGIYFPSSGTLTIDNSTINAKTMGAQVCSGSLNVNSGSKITVSGDPVAKTEGDGAIQDGAAISIVNRAGYKGLGQIAITGGTFTAKDDNAAIKVYTWDSSTKQESAFDNSAKTVAVSGGTFSSAVTSDLCAEGYAPVENDDDTYGVGTVVAEAAGKQFASLYDAVQAVKRGGTVKLLADAESPYTLVCRGKVTFDLGEYTITNTNKSGIASVIKATNGAVVTVNATTGGINAGSGAMNNYAFYANSGTIIINGGNYTVGLDKNGDGNAIAYADKAWGKGPGTIRVNGGTFEAAAAKNGHSYVLNAQDNSGCTIEVKGGTFKNFDPSNNICEGEGTNFVAAGYAVTAVENGSDTLYTVSQAVAQVGTKAFASLQAAIDAAQAGDTVQLLGDVVIDDTIIVQDKGTITLDLNGKTISNTKEIWNDDINNWSLVSVRGNSDLTITGNGAIDALANDSYAIDLQDAASRCAIKNGAFTGNISAAYVFDGSLTINGGTFDIKQLSGQGDHRFTINCYDSSYKNGTAQVSINGGTFNGFDPANNLAEGTGTAFTAPGYTSVANADGTYGVVAGVAKIGTKAYATLADAVAAAQDGDTVQLLGDVEQNSQLTINKNITLDLNGKTIKNTQDIWGEKTNAILSITNGAKVIITGNGTIDAKENDCYTINVVKGDLTIENGTFYGNVSVVQVQEGTLSVKGGTFDLHQKWEGSSKYLFNCIDDAYANGSANVAISGGTFVGFDPNVSPEGEGTSYLAPGYAPVANGDGTYGVKLAEGAYLLQDYRSGDQTSWTYPTKDGMAFAGWYKDAEFKTACAVGDVEGAAYAKFVKISDLITFKGGSLRTDLTGEDDYSKTSLRFGYEMHAPDGAKLDRENWGWTYRNPNSGASASVKAENYWRIDNNGVITNLVIREISKDGQAANYSTRYEVNAQLAYVTKDGTKVCVKDETRVRSVNDVAEAIKNDSFASDVDLKYANGILGE